jgi:hypothetical protein
MCNCIKNIHLLVLKNGDDYYDASIITNENVNNEESNIYENTIVLMTFEETLMYWFGIIISLLLNYYIINEIVNSINLV